MAINTISDKAYIGQTTNTLENRICGHLKHSKPKMRSKSYFHNAVAKYGVENFVWKILCQCKNIREMNEKEKEMIDEYNTLCPNGYNLMTGGLNSAPCEIIKKRIKKGMEEWHKQNPGIMGGKRYPRTDETRRKISRRMKRNIPWNKGIRQKDYVKKIDRKASLAQKVSNCLVSSLGVGSTPTGG